jgi:hypothetical protein
VNTDVSEEHDISIFTNGVTRFYPENGGSISPEASRGVRPNKKITLFILHKTEVTEAKHE